MHYEIKLKNQPEHLIFDQVVFEWLTSELTLTRIDFINNLRKDPKGFVYFEEEWEVSESKYETIKIALYDVLAEKFLNPIMSSTDYNFVTYRNGNKLDFRLENLEYWTSYKTPVKTH